MSHAATSAPSSNLPKWVPLAARHYLAHTEDGLSIRALARATDCHPSTILRQVRRFEGRRDDPLIDAALKALADRAAGRDMDDLTEDGDDTQSKDRIDAEALRILRRLCEPRALLAVAREMQTAVVVRETDTGDSLRTAVVDREIAQAMALKGWIACPEEQGRIHRYFITNAGRAALRELTAVEENRAQGFHERVVEPPETGDWSFPSDFDGVRNRSRYYVTESPLIGLSRRKDRDGTPFLDADLVKAGERLREDFELAQIGRGAARTRAIFLKESALAKDDNHISPGARAARDRVRAAVRDLGDGLGDVALRCCCLLEGLEVTEKQLGWSARSGKIVLRIALQRLRLHYEETHGKYGPMIG